MKQMITLTLCLFACFHFAKADTDLPVTVSELPQKAQEFIKQYFPQQEVSFAKVEKDFWEKKYEVVFVNGEKVEFDKNGNWEEVKCKFSVVPNGIVPEKIREQLSKQFPTAKVLKIERDSKGYEIELDNKLEVKFNKSFQLTDIDD